MNKKQINIWVSEDIAEEIEELSKKQMRNKSNMANYLLMFGLETFKKNNAL